MHDLLFDLSGRVAVVTGGASGLAQAIAIGFAMALAIRSAALAYDLSLPRYRSTGSN